MKVSAKLAKERYIHSDPTETYLMVELEALKVEWVKNRAPICLVLVLDISSSMNGDKIDYLQKACRKLVDHLSPGDFAGIVAYNSSVHEIASIREITQSQKDTLKKNITDLSTGGCTNISGGLARALKWINDADLKDDVIQRVVLFTDGLANVDVRGRELLDFTKSLCGKASVSAFGFGNDCDQELLADIANKCGGNFAFIDSPDAALTAFARELGGLMSMYAQDVKVKIRPDKNNEVMEILNDEDVSDKDGVATIGIRDILSEEKKWIVARVKLNKVDNPFPREVNAFEVSVNYKDNKSYDQSISDIIVKTRFCKPGEESKEEDSMVAEQRDRLLAARAQDVAEGFARVGDFYNASNTIKKCANSIDTVAISNTLGNIQSTYESRSSYKAGLGDTNSLRSHFKGKRVLSSSVKACSLIGDTGGQHYAAMDELEKSFCSEDKSTKNDSDDTAKTDSEAVDGVKTSTTPNKGVIVNPKAKSTGYSGASIDATTITNLSVGPVSKKRKKEEW
jgi:Ca-activated chloride channel family protein